MAYLLKMLATSAVATVNAVIQLVANISTTLGMPWASQVVGNEHQANALVPYDSISTLLKDILSHSLSPTAVSSALDHALTTGLGLHEMMSLSVMLQSAAAPALADVWHSDCTKSSLIGKAVTAVVAISLWALISAALPGIGGLLAFGATGMRIGYRQAHARIALSTPELARFVRPGPIGIVRTGSLVSVHQRTARTPGTSRRRHLELAS